MADTGRPLKPCPFCGSGWGRDEQPDRPHEAKIEHPYNGCVLSGYRCLDSPGNREMLNRRSPARRTDG